MKPPRFHHGLGCLAITQGHDEQNLGKLWGEFPPEELIVDSYKCVIQNFVNYLGFSSQ